MLTGILQILQYKNAVKTKVFQRNADVWYSMTVKKKATLQDDSNDVFQAVKQKKRPKTTAITFRIPTDLADRFKAICHQEGVSQTEVVVEILKRAVQGKDE